MQSCYTIAMFIVTIIVKTDGQSRWRKVNLISSSRIGDNQIKIGAIDSTNKNHGLYIYLLHLRLLVEKSSAIVLTLKSSTGDCTVTKGCFMSPVSFALFNNIPLYIAYLVLFRLIMYSLSDLHFTTQIWYLNPHFCSFTNIFSYRFLI